MKNELRDNGLIDKKLGQIIHKYLFENNKKGITNIYRSSSDNLSYINYVQKLIKKNLKKKYNITPEKLPLISIQKFIESKYCREIAVFKENLIFNYQQEFLKRMYNKKESISRIPKFVIYYKNYLLFFCKPIFQELKLAEQLQKYYENKAQIFYQTNYNKEIKTEKNTNDLFTVFTPKIRKLLSNQNSNSHLTIQKVESNSFITVFSFENSILKILNENTNNYTEEKKENSMKKKEKTKPKLMLKITKEKKDLLLNINKKTIEKKDKNNILPTYKKHSRNLIIYNPLYTEENIYLNKKKNEKIIKHFKIFSSHNPNMNKKKERKNSIIPPLRIYNIEKQRTPSVSIRRNSISSRKNQPKLFTNLYIPCKTEGSINNNNNNIFINNQFVNPFKTSSTFFSNNNKRNRIVNIKTKLSFKNSKFNSNFGFNQIKQYIQFQKNNYKIKQ